jgi:hypothetical protein
VQIFTSQRNEIAWYQRVLEYLYSFFKPDVNVNSDFDVIFKRHHSRLFVVYYSAALNSVQAMEGALKFCGQTYNTSVTSTQTKTKSIESWGALDMAYSVPRSSGPPIYPLIGGQHVLSVDQDVSTAMGIALDQVFQGNWAESDNENQFFLTPDGSISTAAQVLSILLFNETESMTALQNFTDKLSIALTNK